MPMPKCRFVTLTACACLLVAGVSGGVYARSHVEPPATTAMPLAEAIRLFATPNLRMSPAQSVAATKAINDAETAHRAEVSWQLGHALVLRSAGAKQDARACIEKVIAAEPAVADHQFWYGTLCFETIDTAGMFEQMGLANKGKAAYDEALRLDPTHVSARIGLFQFYSGAPTIAGGSTTKAKALCDELLALADGKGEYFGQVFLAQLAAKSEDWAEMARRYTLAETARGEGAGALNAIRAHARSLLNAKKDPDAALAMIERALPLNASDDAQTWFIAGQVHQKLKHMDAAAEAFGKAVEINPTGAPNSLYGLAECLEATGKFKDAAKRYADFAALFPKDERAEKAGEKSKACAKKAG